MKRPHHLSFHKKYHRIMMKAIAAVTIFSALLIGIPGNYYPVYAAEAASSDISLLPVITSFSPLSVSSTVTYADKPALESIISSFPQTLSVYLDNMTEITSLSVTWSCSTDYENTSDSTYLFTPSWDNALYSLSPSLDPVNDIPSISIHVNSTSSSIVLIDPATAASTLTAIAESKDILALVYLCNSYDVKEDAGKDASTLITASSGQSVCIKGVKEDLLKNIWYHVSLNVQGTAYDGYIERKYLAFSDEDLVDWERQNINIYRQRSAISALSDPYEDVNNFPASYQSALKTLKDNHPNWTFVPVNTDLDFMTSVQKENEQNRSLISSTVNSAWISRPSSNSKWPYPNNEILAYFMDPRNFLKDSAIFQFELLSYNATYHTPTAVSQLLANSFMSGLIPNDASTQTYAQAFCAIASRFNVSPFHLAARVLQEQGSSGKSALISGRYPGYENFYNYFNISASGSNDTEIIQKGLAKAREKNWNTRYSSLTGGSDIITQEYIQRGQNTLYFQKFNVQKGVAGSPYTHQYMQNIMAPYTESLNIQKAYANAGSMENRFVFSIPVYNNMPAAPCAQPVAAKQISLNKTVLSLQINASYTLSVTVDGAAAAPSSVSFTSTDSSIAAVDANGIVTAVSAGTATITCSVSGGKAYCTVTVSKGSPGYTVPVLGKVVYSPTQTLGNITLPAGWAWDSPGTVPTVVNSGYPATFTPSDSSKYNNVNITIGLTVDKGTPLYSIPSGLQTSSGNTLASIKLPLGFSWETPSTLLSSEGTYNYKASYNPDASNYNTVSSIKVPVTVTSKTGSCTTHSFGKWEHITVPSCTAPGSDVRSCRLCGYQETTAIAALGHSYTGAITKEPTCTEKGTKVYTCFCGGTYPEELNSLGHDMSGNKCKRCGYKEASSSSPESQPPTVSDKNTDTTLQNKPDTSPEQKTPSAPKAPASDKASAANKNQSAKTLDKANITIDMQSDTMIDSETLSSIKGEDINVVLNMGQNVSWSINGNNLTEELVNGIDMGILINSGKIPSELLKKAEDTAAPYPVIEISFAHEGAFDFNPTLTFNTSKDNIGKIANLYYYNAETGLLEYADSVEITETGDISFTIAQAADYIVIISESVMADTAVIGEPAIDETNNAATEDLEENALNENDINNSDKQLNIPAIVIIALIIIIAIVIGITIFFLLKKNEEDEENSEEENDDNIDVDDMEYDDMEDNVLAKKNLREENLDEEDFIDDYHEPAVKRRAGKVTSLTEEQNLLKKSNIENKGFEKDEFDGFE